MNTVGCEHFFFVLPGEREGLRAEGSDSSRLGPADCGFAEAACRLFGEHPATIELLVEIAIYVERRFPSWLHHDVRVLVGGGV